MRVEPLGKQRPMEILIVEDEAGIADFLATPGARTAWHTHPLGQTILVTEGMGLCQREGGLVEVIRSGDRVYFEPDENHWHGATADRFMTHLAMQEVDDSGSPVTWGEHVSDEGIRDRLLAFDSRLGERKLSNLVAPKQQPPDRGLISDCEKARFPRLLSPSMEVARGNVWGKCKGSKGAFLLTFADLR
jgi:quercetin dioxygenase-like cupin family protein